MSLSIRAQSFAGFGICVALMAAAYYFQYGLNMEPCPLCIFQRVGVTAVGLIFLVQALHNPAGWGRRVYGGLLVLVAGLGTVIAARHVWLQNLPKDEVPACGPGLNYLLDNFPFGKMLDTVFRGSGECADLHWAFLGLSMPAWVLAFFVAFALLGLVRIAGR